MIPGISAITHKPAVAGEAVLLHRVCLAANVQLVVVGFAHGGEEYRRMAVPEGRIAAPHILAAAFGEADQFGSVFGDFDRQDVVGEFHFFLGLGSGRWAQVARARAAR